jgi:hypothetical protein
MSIDVNGYWIGSKNLPHLIKKAGFTRKTAQTGAVTLIQRFGSALNLNVPSHMLFLDGVYIERADGGLRFCWVKAPTSVELNQLTQTLARRIGRYLERQGLRDGMLKTATWLRMRLATMVCLHLTVSTVRW